MTSFAVLGMRAASSAFHCATDARYVSVPLRVAELRRSSREIVEGGYADDFAVDHAVRDPQPLVLAEHLDRQRQHHLVDDRAERLGQEGRHRQLGVLLARLGILAGDDLAHFPVGQDLAVHLGQRRAGRAARQRADPAAAAGAEAGDDHRQKRDQENGGRDP